MLDDKNEEISEIKEKMKLKEEEVNDYIKAHDVKMLEKQLAKEIQARDELEMKYSDAKEVINDLELQIQDLKEDLQKQDDVIAKQQKDQKKLNEAIDIYDKEILNVKATIQQDIDEIQDKNDRIMELEQILRQCNESLI